MRTGDEPSHARSPLRLRLSLAVFGLASTLTGAILLADLGQPGWAAAFAVVALVALIDIAVVIHRLRQGPHYQPGPGTPPYRPLDRQRGPAAVRVRPPAPIRMRRYLVLMTLCVALLLLGWIWVARFSTTAAVVITVFAMLIPPIAAIVANTGGLLGTPRGPQPRRDGDSSRSDNQPK